MPSNFESLNSVLAQKLVVRNEIKTKLTALRKDLDALQADVRNIVTSTLADMCRLDPQDFKDSLGKYAFAIRTTGQSLLSACVPPDQTPNSSSVGLRRVVGFNPAFDGSSDWVYLKISDSLTELLQYHTDFSLMFHEACKLMDASYAADQFKAKSKIVQVVHVREKQTSESHSRLKTTLIAAYDNRDSRGVFTAYSWFPTVVDPTLVAEIEAFVNPPAVTQDETQVNYND